METPSPSTPKSSTTPMDRAAFHAHMESTFAECLALSKRKNADYAGNSDPFANFRQVQNLGLCSVSTGILVRLSDKFTRISNLLAAEGREAAVTDESVVDTIRDAINYLAILAAWLDEERGVPKQTIGAIGDILPTLGANYHSMEK